MVRGCKLSHTTIGYTRVRLRLLAGASVEVLQLPYVQFSDWCSCLAGCIASGRPYSAHCFSRKFRYINLNVTVPKKVIIDVNLRCWGGQWWITKSTDVSERCYSVLGIEVGNHVMRKIGTVHTTYDATPSWKCHTVYVLVNARSRPALDRWLDSARETCSRQVPYFYF